MTSLDLLVVQAFLASLFTRRNFVHFFSFLTVFMVSGGLFLVSSEVHAISTITTELTKIQDDVVAVLGDMLGAVIAIGVAAIAVFIANTILRWLRVSA